MKTIGVCVHTVMFNRLYTGGEISASFFSELQLLRIEVFALKEHAAMVMLVLRHWHFGIECMRLGDLEPALDYACGMTCALWT